MTAELFTVATHPTPGLARLQRSLGRFGIPITILGQDESEFRGYGWKFKTVLRGIRESRVDTVLFCDGYDTLCLEPLPDILGKFVALSHPIIFSHEPGTDATFCPALNSGLLMADREALLA